MFNEKPFLPDHLTNPYIYITKIVEKVPDYSSTFSKHEDVWNGSTHLKSGRKEK